MAKGKSGYFDLTGSNATFAFRVNWSETYEIASNKSAAKIDSMQVKSTGLHGFMYYPDGLIKINGIPVVTMDASIGTHNVYIQKAGEWYDILTGGEIATGSVEVAHNADGSKSVSIEVAGNRYSKCFFYTLAGGTDGGSGWGVAGSKTVDLTTIPRASTISATDANIGSKNTIVVNRKSSAYTHSIAYKFGNLSGYIADDGGISSAEVKLEATTINFTIPTSFYSQIPNAKSGTCTLTCKTYSGTTQIGDTQSDTFTVTAAQSLSAPSVSGTVVDSNTKTKNLTGDEKKLVRYKSTALCTITAKAKNSSTISQKKIAGSVVSGNTISIEAVEVSSFAFYAKDSRGYEGSATVETDLIPYVLLSCNSEAFRTDSTSGNAVLSIKGNYFNGSFGYVENSLQVKYRIMPDGGEYGDYVTVNPTISGNTYSTEVELSGLDYKNSFSIEVVVMDAIDSLEKTATIEQGIPNWDMGVDDFRINALLRLSEANHGTVLPESGVKDQIFLLYTNGSWAIKIHDGEHWK